MAKRVRDPGAKAALDRPAIFRCPHKHAGRSCCVRLGWHERSACWVLHVSGYDPEARRG